MEKIKIPLVRVNTRITHDQHKFIKEQAKKTRRTEGEVFRLILDDYIKLNTK
jgi:hypothetical protein